jgi:hypothetical protein
MVRYANEAVCIVLVANKTDLAAQRVVTEEEGRYAFFLCPLPPPKETRPAESHRIALFAMAKAPSGGVGRAVRGVLG